MKQPGRTEKIYTAVVTGRIDNEEGIIDLPIGKLSPDKVKRGIVSEDHGGRASISMYKVTDRYSVTTVNGSKRSSENGHRTVFFLRVAMQVRVVCTAAAWPRRSSARFWPIF